jgi:hypothetical protein
MSMASPDSPLHRCPRVPVCETDTARDVRAIPRWRQSMPTTAPRGAYSEEHVAQRADFPSVDPTDVRDSLAQAVHLSFRNAPTLARHHLLKHGSQFLSKLALLPPWVVCPSSSSRQAQEPPAPPAVLRFSTLFLVRFKPGASNRALRVPHACPHSRVRSPEEPDVVAVVHNCHCACSGVRQHLGPENDIHHQIRDVTARGCAEGHRGTFQQRVPPTSERSYARNPASHGPGHPVLCERHGDMSSGDGRVELGNIHPALKRSPSHLAYHEYVVLSAPIPPDFRRERDARKQ